MKLFDLINQFLEWLYNLISSIFLHLTKRNFLIKLKTFKYAISGGSNLVLGWVMYFIIFNLFFSQAVVTIPFINKGVKSALVTNVIVWFINFIVGFLLMKYVVFTESDLRGRTQLVRYFSTSIFALLLSTILLKLFLDYTPIMPTIANICSTLIVVGVSYILQSKFSFKEA